MILVRLAFCLINGNGNGRQSSVGDYPGFSPRHSIAMESVVEEEDIDKRNAGCGAFIGDLLYIWGGRSVSLGSYSIHSAVQ